MNLINRSFGQMAKISMGFLVAVVAQLGVISSAQAAFESVCTASNGGCTPDFDVNAVGSYDHTQNKLTVTGSAGNIGFKIDQILDHNGSVYTSADDKYTSPAPGAPGNANDKSNLQGILGFSLLFTDFEMNLFFDGAGAVTSGDIRLGASGGPSGATDSWIQDSIHGIGLDAVHVLDDKGDSDPTNDVLIELKIDNTDDDGWLVGNFDNATGGIGILGDTIQLGINGGEATDGLLSLFSNSIAVSGDIGLANAGIAAEDLLTSSWSGNFTGLDIVVPVPAAWILYLSGCLLPFARKVFK